ncbi:unnamed protein product, partial [Didymodactylos carnosus]
RQHQPAAPARKLPWSEFHVIQNVIHNLNYVKGRRPQPQHRPLQHRRKKSAKREDVNPNYRQQYIKDGDDNSELWPTSTQDSILSGSLSPSRLTFLSNFVSPNDNYSTIHGNSSAQSKVSPQSKTPSFLSPSSISLNYDNQITNGKRSPLQLSETSMSPTPEYYHHAYRQSSRLPSAHFNGSILSRAYSEQLRVGKQDMNRKMAW